MAAKKKAEKTKKVVPKKPAAKKKSTATKTTLPKKSRNFDGASKGKRLSRWKTQSTSANTESFLGIVTLRNRARDLRRNNPYARRGIEAITSNVVGDGILTQYRGSGAAALEAQWALWAESTEIDFDGRNNIYGLQALVMDAVAESGEVLVRERYDSSKDFPLQLQVLEADFLDTNRNETSTQTTNIIIQGIEFDKQGRRVAYYLFEQHPGSFDQQILGATVVSNRVPVSEVHHIYRMDRPGQARGITWLAPIVVRLKDLDDYEDAQLVRQKIAACFTAFIRDIGPDMTDADEECADEDLGDRVEPGIIEHLPPGKTVEFGNPPEVQNYEGYVTKVLQSIAVGIGVTYEVLTNDYSNVNFSSGRMGWIELGRNIKAWRERIMNAHFLNPIAKSFLRTAEVMGMPTSGITVVHVPPKREMIDPTKEVAATKEAIRAGLTTLSDELMAQGKDPEEHLEQYQKDLELLDELGLKLESDPRVSPNGQNTAQNSSQDTTQGGIDEEGQDKAAGSTSKSHVSAKILQQRTQFNGRSMDHGRESEAVDLVRGRLPRGTIS